MPPRTEFYAPSELFKRYPTISKRALITGAAGFIGSHLAESLLSDGWHVTGVDNFDGFYPEVIKRRNLAQAVCSSNFELVVADIRRVETLDQLLPGGYDAVIHLAAKAGVRPSIEDPVSYLETNVLGTQNVLELARKWKTPQFVFGSSSSVYGLNPDTPWSEDCSPLLPISPYASTKLSAELMGHVYSRLYGIRFIALRFFTVYGPRQRPDLAINKFARLIKSGESIPIFGRGDSCRDYTYIADICDGIKRAIAYDKEEFAIFNLGNDRPVSLRHLVQALGNALGENPRMEYHADQPGDVPQTWANIQKARMTLGYCPRTALSTGLANFTEWLQSQSSCNPGLQLAAHP